MEQYQQLEIEVIEFETEDVITESTGGKTKEISLPVPENSI